MTAVIYARYSSDSQREESIEGQIRECTAFAEKNGITILRHYIDRAFSAKTDNRPEFQNMIKDSGKRLFDMIIVWKLDRFARNRYDRARYKAALKKNGVKVVSSTEVISDGAEGIILESVLEGYAEYYSADLSEKVVRGMTDNALKCKFNGGTLPIGYQIDADQHFQIDPLTAPFVLEAFKKYDEGATMTEIRDWLNEQGLKNTRGQPLSYNSVGHLLHNRRYIGEFSYRDVVVPDGIPAIVPQDLFDRVQEKLEKNRKAPARHKAEEDYLLTTKLFCGYCGAYLCGESGTSHTGVTHRYYKCVSVKKRRGCHKKSVRKEWIEDFVVHETMKMVMDDKAIEAIVSTLMDLQDRENVSLPLYEQQLGETNTAINNLLNAIQQGILTKSTKARLDELEATKEELETKIACEKLAKPKVSAEFMTFWLYRFRKLDVRQKSHRKMLIDAFVNAIYLYDDKMLITFNYKEGTQTVTFDEVNEALENKENGSDLDCSGAPRRSKLHIACSDFFAIYVCFSIHNQFTLTKKLRSAKNGTQLFQSGHLLRLSHSRVSMVASSARVAVAVGVRALLAPVTRPVSTAHCMALWAQLLTEPESV
jgi:DNA invertase Pin-like site-specific DNA recombinase